jgi:hypothetical protein
LAGETEALGDNLVQCHIVRHKSYMNWPGPPQWEAND